MKRFARMGLLLSMAAFAAVIAAVVLIASPYAPVIEPAGDIEALWAIEDTRTESEAPLVTALQNNGVPLAYDAGQNTFYCTLGMDNGDAWPQIHLTAPGTEGVELIFSDDYTYDWCADAIRDGYSYEVMAYTDTQYAYFAIVFTGLPLICMETDEEITKEDTAADVTISAYGYAPVISAANVHARGGGTATQEKLSLRVNFTRSAYGKKNTVDLPGFGLRSDIILNGMCFDEMLMREKFGWDLYDAMLGEDYDGAFDERKTEYAELFVNGEYRGLYLMMEPVNPDEELSKEGSGAQLTDSVYRSLAIGFVDERPWQYNACSRNSVFEWRYDPSGAGDFTAFQAYNDLLAEPDDAAFAKKAEALIDMESLIRHGILCQAGGFVDNVHNNMYLWAHKTPEGIKYRFAPWDMDTTLGKKREQIGWNYENWVTVPLLDRILLLDVADARQRYADMWRQYRESFLTTDDAAALLQGYARQMTDSGALVRNAQRWELSVDDTAGYEIAAFMEIRLPLIDRAVERLTSEEAPSFLDIDWYDSAQKYPPLIETGGE